MAGWDPKRQSISSPSQRRIQTENTTYVSGKQRAVVVSRSSQHSSHQPPINSSLLRLAEESVSIGLGKHLGTWQTQSIYQMIEWYPEPGSTSELTLGMHSLSGRAPKTDALSHSVTPSHGNHLHCCSLVLGLAFQYKRTQAGQAGQPPQLQLSTPVGAS